MIPSMQALRLIAVPLGLVLAGCGSNGWQDPEPPESQMPEPEPELQPVAVALVSGSGQEGLAGGSLDQPFVVRVTDAAGRPAPGVPVEWTTDLSVGEGFFCFDTPDQCHLPGYSVNTDAQGHSRVWFHPMRLGGHSAVAKVTGLQGSPVTFTVEVIGVLVWFGPTWDCTGRNDLVRFFGPAQPDHITVPAGTPVVFEYDRLMAPVCSARVISTSTPPGAPPFDSEVLHPGDRFGFVPAVTGTWDFVDQVSGGTGKLTAK